MWDLVEVIDERVEESGSLDFWRALGAVKAGVKRLRWAIGNLLSNAVKIILEVDTFCCRGVARAAICALLSLIRVLVLTSKTKTGCSKRLRQIIPNRGNQTRTMMKRL